MAISTEDIEKMISTEIGALSVEAQDNGGKYQIRVVADFFAGLNSVKRQQAIYKILNPYISSGEIHAVSMKLLTQEEQQQN